MTIAKLTVDEPRSKWSSVISMFLAETQSEPITRIFESIGTSRFLNDLGGFLLGAFGADAYSFDEVDERRRSVSTLARGASDPAIAAAMGARPQLGFAREIADAKLAREVWVSEGQVTDPVPAVGVQQRSTVHAVLSEMRPVPVVLSLTRLKRADGSGAGIDRQRFAIALPLLRSMWRAHARTIGFETERNALFEALSHRGLGVITIDTAATVISINRRATELMSETGALKVSMAGLYTNDPIQMEQLATAIEAIRAELRKGGRATMRSLTLTSPASQRSVRLQLYPIPVGMPQAGHRSPMIAAVVTDPQADLTPHVRESARLYGLTSVETELVCLLATGASIDAAAATLSVSPHTARKYLQQVFSKTGTSRQSDLLMLMISGGAPSAPSRAASRSGAPTSAHPSRVRALPPDGGAGK